jgi:starch synthase
MKILSVAPEVYPLIKTGGLADVAGALPLALSSHGVATRTLLPGYPQVLAHCTTPAVLAGYDDLFDGHARLVGAEVAGLDLMLLDAPHLFDRPGGPYGGPAGGEWPDNWRRFAAFSKVAADVAAGIVPGYVPDVVHVHDWQAAMTVAYMKYGAAAALPTVVTVHNLAFQGQFGADIFPHLGLPTAAMALDGVEYYGGVGYLKAGLQSAWAITTVSPTYAQEIRTPEFGMGLDGLINQRAADVHGIVNGIDTSEWDPQTDPHLAARYSARTLKARAQNRKAVEHRFGLAQGGPLFCVISRLTWQKGMDILMGVIDGLAATGARLAVLGSGDRALEGALLAAVARHQGRIGVVIGYDEGLSHLMQGGCDAILVPSRFEPCGLTQLYGLRYGCVPVVARTGGLADTVIDANEAALAVGVATGFLFPAGNGEAMLQAVRRAVAVHGDASRWSSLQKQGMKADVSWTRSAGKYADLYRSLISRRHSGG